MLNLPDQNPYSSTKGVGLVVRRSNATQNHVGILYLHEQLGPRICHLAWHHRLLFEAPDNSYLWVDLEGLDDENRLVASAFFRALEEEMPHVPYGFGIDGECFHQDGTFISPPVGQGLTCATFVVAALNAQGHKILDELTWPDREQDAVWQAHIIEMLEQHSDAPQEHINALKSLIGATRIRPEEVVASGVHQPWPTMFDDVSSLAEQVLLELPPA